MKLPPKVPAPLGPKPPPLPMTPKPLVHAFTIVKRNGRRHVVALQLRGREVLDELVTDSCDWLEEAVDRLEILIKDAFLYDRDVFDEERRSKGETVWNSLAQGKKEEEP